MVGFVMPLAVGMMGQKIMRPERPARTGLLHPPLQRVGPAGRGAVGIDGTARRAEKRTGRRLALIEFQFEAGKVRMAALAKGGMPAQKFAGFQGEPLLETKDIVGKEQHVHVPAAGQVATHPRMALKPERLLGHGCTARWQVRVRERLRHEFLLGKKKAGMIDSYQLCRHLWNQAYCSFS